MAKQLRTLGVEPMPALRNMPASDVRDWTAIRVWASDLAAQFQPALSATSTKRKYLTIFGATQPE